MAKSRPKHKKLARPTVRPSKRLVPKPRSVVRSARRRTRPPSLARVEALNGVPFDHHTAVYAGVLKDPYPVEPSPAVPLRTLARTKVLAQAESLGVTLGKPQLRKAIDRAVKGLKAALAPVPYARPPIDSPAPQEPASTAALGEVASYDRPFSQMVRDEMSGIHPLLGPLGERGREHASLNAPQISRSASPAPSAWEASYATLDETVNRLSQRIHVLGQKLSPVLLPPHTPPASGAEVSTTGPGLHVLEGVERQRQHLDALCTVVVDLVERLVI